METRTPIRSTLTCLLFAAIAIGATAPTLAADEVSFRPPRYYGLGNPEREPTGIVAADFDGDGVLDVATPDYETDTVTILRGQGAGKLSLWQTRVVCNNPRALDAADLNGDGLVDLAVACRLQKAVVVLAGNGDLSFQPPQELEVGYVPNDVLIEDVDGDGNLDLVSADQGSDTVSVLFGRGGGLFDPAQGFAVGSNPLAVASGDLDGDGAVDLVTANLMSSNVSVLLGDGWGGFSPAQHVYVGGGQAHWVAVADFNGDGFDDVACAVFTSEVRVMLSNGDGTLRSPERFDAGTRPYHLAAGDLNDDGRPDLIASGHTFVVLEGAGDGTFPFFQAQAHRQGSYLGVTVAIADLDADGRPDVVTADRSLSDVGVFLNHTVPLVPGSVQIAAEDFEDGLPDEMEGWHFQSSGPTGRFEVVDGRLRMDASTSGTYVRNEADWVVDLSGVRSIRLGFLHYEIEWAHPLPPSFADHADGDGVAISVDRTSWYTLTHGPHLDVGGAGRDFVFDLDRAAERIRADHDPGFALGATTWIRFQQYDRTSDPFAGREWDAIELTGVRGNMANLPPRPVIGVTPEAPVAEGAPVRLSVQNVGDPNPGDTHTFEWRLGDGHAAGGRGPIDHVYPDDGLFTVDLWATDQDGLEGHGQAVVSITNVPPVVEAGVDLSGETESPVSFTGQFTDPGLLDTHAVVWDFGDGQGSAGTLTPSHTYLKPGTYTVSLVVDDGDGGIGGDTLVVTVAPVYRLQIDTLSGGPFRGPEGGPFAPSCLTYQVRNLHDQPRGWSASFDQDWLVATPVEGTLAAGAAETVQVCLAPGAGALGAGEHPATATFLEPNGLTHSRDLALSVAGPSPTLPYHQTFDGGLPGEAQGFRYYTSDAARGRTAVVDGRLRMDVSSSGGYALNEAELTLDLTGATEVELSFFQADHSDERHSLPLRFEGHAWGDGVSMSADGVTWYRLLGDAALEVTSSGRSYTVSLDAERDRVRAVYDPGFRYGSGFRIRFQQYDNYTYPTDGREWDDIQVTGLRTDLRVTPDEEVVARGPQGGPLDRDCQSYSLTNVGDGELPWSASVNRAWLSVAPESGSLAPQGSTSVDVCWEALALLPGSHEGQAVFVDTEAGWAQGRDVTVAIQSDGRLPYSQDFSAGLPSADGFWEYYRSDPLRGRIEVQNGRLRMDSNLSGYYSLNEAVLTLDLVASTGVQLRFFHSEHNDEIHSLPPSFAGHAKGDGVAVSADGITWYTVLNAAALDVGAVGRTLSVALDAEVSRIRGTHDPSFGYSSAFKIKLQHYDNYTYPTDGREWDDVSVTTMP